MYNLTRQETAKKLNISIRTVDRHIKSGKIRTKKHWKSILIKESDVENLLYGWNIKQKIIFWEKDINDKKITKYEDDTNPWMLEKIYEDLKKQIQEKDKVIQNLFIKIWKFEEIAKNSISLIDFKKSQFLLEESKWSLHRDIKNISKKNEKLKKDLKYEKITGICLMVFVIFLATLLWVVWFIKI